MENKEKIRSDIACLISYYGMTKQKAAELLEMNFATFSNCISEKNKVNNFKKKDLEKLIEKMIDLYDLNFIEKLKSQL